MISKTSTPTVQYVVKIEDKASCLITLYNNGKANVLIVDDVKVEEQYRRQGLATKLLQQVILIAKDNNVDSIELAVNRDSIAEKLYAKIGFIKTEKDYCRIILNKF
jgi:GNAT superfamily N-acetyltransferase